MHQGIPSREPQRPNYQKRRGSLPLERLAEEHPRESERPGAARPPSAPTGAAPRVPEVATKCLLRLIATLAASYSSKDAVIALEVLSTLISTPVSQKSIR